MKSFQKVALLGILPLFLISGKVDCDESAFQNTQKLFLCIGALGSAGQAFAASNNLQYVGLVGQASIDPSNDLTVHEDLLNKRIVQLFPDSNASGYAILDWEGNGMNLLTSLPQSDPQFQLVLGKFISALQYAKKLRPNVKWSYYGMPTREYWHMNAQWQQKNQQLIPLLKMCDMLTPSLYKPYSDASGQGNNQAYVNGNVQLELKIGAQLNLSVYPLVWHRLPDNTLLSKDEFLRHVKAILNQKYNGAKPAGVIWWDADQYMYNVRSKPLMNEVGGQSQNFTPYHDKLIVNYGQGILSLMGK